MPCGAEQLLHLLAPFHNLYPVPTCCTKQANQLAKLHYIADHLALSMMAPNLTGGGLPTTAGLGHTPMHLPSKMLICGPETQNK